MAEMALAALVAEMALAALVVQLHVVNNKL